MDDPSKLTVAELLQSIAETSDAISTVAKALKVFDRIKIGDRVAREQVHRSDVQTLVKLCRERDDYLFELDRRYPSA
ncbi:MAG: hypothetical protein ABSG18_21980 [Steroidobacteraceae bacterium]|jgi:hypothetical protein